MTETCKNCKFRTGSKCRKIKEFISMNDWCSAYKEDTETFLKRYREQQKNKVYSEEELYEMRAAFGEGETVVNVVTGKRITL